MVASILDALHGFSLVCLVPLGEFSDAFFVNLRDLRQPLGITRLPSTVRACLPGIAFKFIDLSLVFPHMTFRHEYLPESATIESRAVAIHWMNFANIRMERLGCDGAYQFRPSLTIARRDCRHAVGWRDRPFSVLALLPWLFASLLAESCLVFDTSFWDCRIVSASFAFARAVISPLSLVFGISFGLPFLPGKTFSFVQIRHPALFRSFCAAEP
jgi:hypothetical protein